MYICFVAALALFACCLASCNAHGFMSYPNSRGSLSGCGGKYKFQGIKADCPTDYCPMCQNAGFLMKRTSGESFSFYKPMDRTERIRGNFGMCGDKTDASDAPHMKAGFFSQGCRGYPTISGLKPGDVINFQVQSTAHHQGFYEFFLCDTTECGGDISRGCFYENQCVQLDRVPNSSCESGNDHDCAPIDPEYPGRWYMGCPKYPWLFSGTSEMTEDQTMGGPNGKMAYRIPPDFNCGKNCVLQSYWATANTCNPLGLKEYFEKMYSEGKLGSWKGCPGDGITRGGYSPQYPTCGERGTFPEEFWNCADIQMEGARFNNHNYNAYYKPGNLGRKRVSSGSSHRNVQASGSRGGSCYKNGERCMGAPGKPYVPWKKCCDGNARQIEDPARGWGKFCLP